jgi:hypothetical protein
MDKYQIELHPLHVVLCKGCKEYQIVKMIEGQIRHDYLCKCGKVTKKKRIEKSDIAFFFDCDKCGEEVFIVLDYSIDDHDNVILEQGITVACPVCFYHYPF